jgi:hypothetical protein
MVLQTEIEFVHKKLNIFRTTSASSGVLVLSTKFISVLLSFLYTNSISVCETT